LKSGDGEIENVLVVDSIEFGVFDEIDAVRKFEDDAAFGLEERFQAGDEVIGIGGMGEDIVAKDEVGFFAGGGEFICDVVAEKFDESFDAFFACNFGDIGSGLNAEAGDFRFAKILKEVTVIAGDFDDVALGVQRKIADVTFDGFAGVLERGIGKGGKVEVFGEELGGRDKVGDLEQPAGLADSKPEGEFGFRLGEIFWSQEIVGEGLQAEVEDEFAVGGIAGAAAEGV
jgi:hypothetical protein